MDEGWQFLLQVSMLQVYSVLDISPDGKYLAAGCYDGHILVFDIKTKMCLDRYVIGVSQVNKEFVCHMAF